MRRRGPRRSRGRALPRRGRRDRRHGRPADERQHGGRGRLAAMRGDELAQKVGRERRRVAGEDQHVVGAALERGARGADRVAGAERLLAAPRPRRPRRRMRPASTARRRRRSGRRRPRAPRSAPSRPCAGRAPGGGASAASSACACRALRPSRRLRSGCRSRNHEPQARRRLRGGDPDSGAERSGRWLGRQDSNLGSRDQNPLPYRLATPHCEPSIGAPPPRSDRPGGHGQTEPRLRRVPGSQRGSRQLCARQVVSFFVPTCWIDTGATARRHPADASGDPSPSGADATRPSPVAAAAASAAYHRRELDGRVR